MDADAKIHIYERIQGIDVWKLTHKDGKFVWYNEFLAEVKHRNEIVKPRDEMSEMHNACAES